MKTTPKREEIYVRIDHNTALKLSKLGYIGQTQSEIITKLVDHAHICDKWWLDRDEDKS